jgi:hypothetical protein
VKRQKLPGSFHPALIRIEICARLPEVIVVAAGIMDCGNARRIIGILPAVPVSEETFQFDELYGIFYR